MCPQFKKPIESWAASKADYIIMKICFSGKEGRGKEKRERRGEVRQGERKEEKEKGKGKI